MNPLTPIEKYKTASALSCVEVLRLVFPPQAIIHIGAGAGNGDMQVWRHWQVANALIIDADEACLDWAVKLAAKNPGWQVCPAVLADTEGEADYYNATNPAEDGLILPEKLAAFWPNLRTSNQVSRQIQRLDALMNTESLAVLRQSQSTWALIDCLSALPIIQGAGDEIGRWSVLWLRVLLKPLDEEQTVNTLQDIEDFLSPLGFRCIHVTEGNHPAIGEALFMRDWQAVLTSEIEQFSKKNVTYNSEKAALEQLLSKQAGLLSDEQNKVVTLTQARDEQTKLAAERQARIETLTQERDNHAKQAQDKQAQLEALTQANTTLTQEKAAFVEKHDALAKEAATLIQARDEQTKLAAERQARIETLTQERDNHAKQAQDKQAQLEALTQANTSLAQEKSAFVEKYDALAKEAAMLTQARDEQTKLAAERQALIETLTQERDDRAKQAQDKQTQLEALTQANKTLAQENVTLVEKQDALTNETTPLIQARDEQIRISNQYKDELNHLQSQLQQKEELIANLESQLAENDIRQRLLNEEMIKAEAQIDLIKDVLLREPGL
jgi:hypothetical protein